MLDKIANLIAIRNFLSQALNDMSIRIEGDKYRKVNNVLTELNRLIVDTSLKLNYEEELNKKVDAAKKSAKLAE
jgi:hypothetical protein